MNKVNVGLVGFGLSGQVFHAPIIQSVEGMEIVKVVSSNPDKVGQYLPDASVVTSLEELLFDEHIDLVVITSPNQTHYPYAKQALLAGKHVIVEKPFVISSEEAEDLIETAKLQNKKLSVYQNRRWDNDFLTVKSLIASGKLGDIASYETHYDRFRPQVSDRWREKAGPGSGMLYDLGAHLIDQTLHLFGKPASVYADLLVQRTGSEVVDYFHLILTYENMRVILHSGSLVMQHGPRFQVHGSQGSFIKYGLDSQEDMLRRGGLPGQPDWGKDREDWYGDLTLTVDGQAVTSKVPTQQGSYERFYEGMYQAITDNKPVPVDAADAMNTIRVIELAIQSSREKRVLPFN
ncbi:scyllo-inositol 2-dehydrogenase (NADP+) [Paenibacillus catalpae]|uniref:Scyllo-inositol 2-dehydrogenase (NADP+) n=1 Tax=Paenibacillus catalpae TaxID=1045775 RepID=A0A1I1XG51_9BACL|nr:oxidoreductase [Paenibacillus catalpae]SFE06272.1 scyllo-inositol 2-dehydrogenase (NADP+) [Paenibacillus catalpae]